MPDWNDELRRRLRGARLRGAAETDVMEELSQHLDDRYAELRARNVDDVTARRMALEELDEEHTLGSALRAVQRERPEPVAPGAPVTGAFMGIGADIRQAVRVLRRAPGFTIIAAAVIALGIGANTAIFSIVNSVLLRPQPGVVDPSSLVAIYTSDYSGPRFGASSYPDYLAMRDADALDGLLVYTPRPLNVTVGERAVRVLGEAVSANYFEVLGVAPERGRFFTDEENAALGQAHVVVLGYGFWQEHFGGADVVGRALRMNGTTVTVVGIAPRDFPGMMRGIRMDAWVPLSAPTSLTGFSPEERGDRGLFVVGRLRAGTTIEAVQARMNGLAAQLHAAYPEMWTDVSDRSRVLTVLPESEARVPRQARGVILGMFSGLMAVVLVVLLIASSNVANLMLTRASSRMREMGVRLALGATRGRVIRQLLTESVLLALLGGVGGVILAVWATRAVNTISLPIPIPVSLDVSLDVRVLAFAMLLTIGTGILFGLLPALQASRAPAPMMKDGASARPRMRLRNALVVVQVTASLMLLIGGGLALRSVSAAADMDTGMVLDNMLLMPLDLSTEGYTLEAAQQLFASLHERTAALPGVAAVSVAQQVPLGLGWSRRGITVADYTPQPGEDMEFGANRVGPGYFETMGIRLAQGRGFSESDRAGAPPVVVVNEAFANRFWPGQNAIGRRIGLMGPDEPFAEVIGVVPDAKYRSLKEDPIPYFYFPYLQHPAPFMTLHVRTATDPARVLPALREQLRALAPGMPVPDIISLRQHVGLATLPQRIAGAVMGVLGALALVIAGIGLYGVIAYGVAQRTKEFGIRSALGAAAGDVQKMVVGQGIRLASIGVVIGTVLALAGAWGARALLFVSPFDPVSVVGVILLLVTTAALASWIPARRAMRVDPLSALRAE